MTKMEDKMEQFVAQGQTSAPAAATPAQGEEEKRERALE
jgi:hypothetical protein